MMAGGQTGGSRRVPRRHRVMRPLDIISIGRSSVDLYGGQIGGRLEDMRTFQKYIGGSPTNTAAGAARLGLKSAVITRVGDEHMGRFIREQLKAEGVDVRGVITGSRRRLTALVLLGIRDRERFPLIFYRQDCADMALSPEDIDPDFIAEARCILASGTHLSHPQTEVATLRAHRSGESVRRQHRPRPRLQAEPLGTVGTWRWRKPLHRVGRRDGKAAGSAEALRCDRRHRGGVPHCRRLDRHARGSVQGSRGDWRNLGLQARCGRCNRFRGSDSGEIWTTGSTERPSGSRCSTYWEPGDGFMAGLLKGWLSGRGLGRDPAHRQCVRRACRVPPRLHPFLSERDRVTPLSGLRSGNVCGAARPAPGADPLGDQQGENLVEHAGLRVRPPDPARTDRQAIRVRAGPHRRIQGPVPGRGASRRRRTRRIWCLVRRAARARCAVQGRPETVCGSADLSRSPGRTRWKSRLVTTLALPWRVGRRSMR